mmetsp:Transcript_39988/g.123552  ORF Transcript_39988/g.123552 Transcript_39988/m.123552 type:complete len:405 (+) Transcript_39988:317-1531(+)
MQRSQEPVHVLFAIVAVPVRKDHLGGCRRVHRRGGSDFHCSGLRGHSIGCAAVRSASTRESRTPAFADAENGLQRLVVGGGRAGTFALFKRAKRMFRHRASERDQQGRRRRRGNTSAAGINSASRATSLPFAFRTVRIYSCRCVGGKRAIAFTARPLSPRASVRRTVGDVCLAVHHGGQAIDAHAVGVPAPRDHRPHHFKTRIGQRVADDGAQLRLAAVARSVGITWTHDPIAIRCVCVTGCGRRLRFVLAGRERTRRWRRTRRTTACGDSAPCGSAISASRLIASGILTSATAPRLCSLLGRVAALLRVRPVWPGRRPTSPPPTKVSPLFALIGVDPRCSSLCDAFTSADERTCKFVASREAVLQHTACQCCHEQNFPRGHFSRPPSPQCPPHLQALPPCGRS